MRVTSHPTSLAIEINHRYYRHVTGYVSIISMDKHKMVNSFL